MRAAPYHLRLREHLARYKREVLGVAEDGTWRYKGQPLMYPHILPAAHQHLNVLDGIRDEFWAYWAKQATTATPPATLHTFFAHLTSSQALAFNLFFPFLGSSRAHPAVLLEALGVAAAGEPLGGDGWRFEAVPDPKEGTNFDVALTFASGRRVLVEVKLTEGEFGRCADDARHWDKRERLYLTRLTGKVADEALAPATFFRRYQLLRNVTYAGPDTHVLFLIPRANTALAGSVAFLTRVLRPDVPVSVRYLEDVLDRLLDGTRGTPLAADVAALARKYRCGAPEVSAGAAR
jgi:hypothetical protein